MHTRLKPAISVLIIALFSSIGVSQTDQQLINRYDKMYAADKYELALKAAETICQRHPESGTWHFFAGALYAKLGDPTQAIEALEVCAANKYTGISSFENNSDLDSLREDSAFIAILNTVRANAKARINEFQLEAKRHTPKSYYPEPSTDRPPVLIALHGTGMDGQSMFNALEDACVELGVILIAPDAIRPAGNGFSWTYRDESKWFVSYLIDQAVEKHNADPERVILLGFSQGANIALILGQTEPERFLAVVPICGHYEAQNAESAGSPAPFYLMTGSRDRWKKTYLNAKKEFESAGGEVMMRMLTGKGHQLPIGKSGTKEYIKAIKWALAQD